MTGNHHQPISALCNFQVTFVLWGFIPLFATWKSFSSERKRALLDCAPQGRDNSMKGRGSHGKGELQPLQMRMCVYYFKKSKPLKKSLQRKKSVVLWLPTAEGIGSHPHPHPSDPGNGDGRCNFHCWRAEWTWNANATSALPRVPVLHNLSTGLLWT